MALQITALEGRVFLTDYVQPTFTKAPRVPPALLRDLANYRRNEYGDPLFRLVWGEQCIKTRGEQRIIAYRKANPTRVQTGWLQGLIRYPMGTDLKLLPPYPIVQKIMDTRWHGFGCWILECWLSPEKLAREWNPRYLYSQREGKVIDWMGPLPEKGCYTGVAFLHDGFMRYHELSESLMDFVRGIVLEAEADPLENPWVENTPELVEKRKLRLDGELQAKEDTAIDELAERFVAENKNPKLMEDMQRALTSDITYHLKRAEELKRHVTSN